VACLGGYTWWKLRRRQAVKIDMKIEQVQKEESQLAKELEEEEAKMKAEMQLKLQAKTDRLKAKRAEATALAAQRRR
jgi:hypothetical protein